MRLSLQECIDYAIKNSYTMKNAHIDVLIQEQQVKQTTAAALPHVNGKIEVNNFIIPQYSYIGAGSFSIPGIPPPPKDSLMRAQFTIPYTANLSASASQILFDGSVLVALQARRTVMEMAKATERLTEEEIRYNVLKSYNSLVIAYKQFDIIKGSLTLLRSMEHDLDLMRQAGFAEKIDIDRTTVQVNNLATDSLRVANNLVVAEQVLKYTLGMNINTPIVLTDTAIGKFQNDALKLVAAEEDITRVPQYNVLMSGLKLNEYNLKRYKLSAIPTLAAVYMLGVNSGAYYGKDLFDGDRYRDNNYSMVGLSLNIPIFNGLSRQHQVTEARLNIEKTRNNIDNFKLAVSFQAATARTSLKNALLQVQSQKRNLDLSGNVLDLAQRKYKEGVGSNLEVTNAQTELMRAQSNYFSALMEVVTAEADLKKALGTLK
ncbi:TolC family protein [Nemorincola caseinilytica]|uniref:TolC family protein n=1 Tax=Nemorincola caseinilytica TaxID=2054315 RepID=A0ABP8NEC8_9BACT